MGAMKHIWHKHTKAVIAGACVLFVALSVSGYKYYKKKHTEPPPVESPSKGDLEVHFKDSGDVAAKTFVDVASKVSGRVIELRVAEGASVAKGQALAVIQPGRTESEHYVPSTLTAPLSGTVMRYVPETGDNQIGKFVRIGDYVTGLIDSQTPTYLMTVADLSRMIIKMHISEMDVLKLSPGLPVSVTVDALTDKTFSGKVSLIAPQAEKNQNGLKVFTIEVEIGQGDARLRPGMTARVDATLQKKEKVMKIPLSTVFEDAGKTFVYLDDGGDKPRKLEVHLGLRGELEAELLAPYTIGEKDKLRTEKPEEKPKSS
ncbi:MAG: efflux RND transporter periplasmic adaptor subunit [Elusimicrobia bacterium]|nr:efflux RND transporter periplasmic adaptor subunit [Elusimicrobiota bacterium]